MIARSTLESQNQMLQPKIILVVDDDKDILQLYSILLTRAGYSVDTAENGADAIEKTKTRRFDLALVDIVLPDMQGTDLLTKINGMNSKMRKIMVTGNATLDNAILALNLGADAYLRKPVKTEVLLESIEAQLRIQREEMLMTQEKISEFIQGKKANFVDIVRESMKSVLGNTGTQAAIYHLGGEAAMQDPTKFVDNLKSVFDVGAETILQEILKNLESSQPNQQN